MYTYLKVYRLFMNYSNTTLLFEKLFKGYVQLRALFLDFFDLKAQYLIVYLHNLYLYCLNNF